MALGLTGASIVWPALLPAALIGMGAFFLLRLLFQGRPSRLSLADWCIGLVAGMGLASLWVSSTWETTVVQVERLLVGILACYALVNWALTQTRLKAGARMIIAAGTGLALAAPFVTAWQDKLNLRPASIYERFPLLVADPSNPNVIAGSLALVFPLALGMLIYGWKSSGWMERILLGMASAVMGLVIVLTQSRGALLATLLGGIFLVSLSWKRAGLWIGVLILFLVLSALIIGGSEFLGYFGSALDAPGPTGREDNWLRATYILRDFPFSGVGMGSFGRVVDAYYPFEGLAPGSVEHAHNLLLQIGVDLGIPGLVGWLGVFFLVVFAAWQIVFRNVSAEPAARPDPAQPCRKVLGLGEGLLAAQLVLLLHGLVDAVTWGMVRPAPLVWIVWGITLAGFQLGENQRNPAPDGS